MVDPHLSRHLTRSRRCRQSLYGAIAALLLATSPAAACLVCVEQPEDTLTDRVWAAEAVVLARNGAEEPFACQVVETLAGETDAPIGFVVNSVERRRMPGDSDRAGLLLHGPRGWSMAHHGGANFAALVRAMLAKEAHWSDMPDDPDRTAAFTALHAHPDPMIRRVALTELSRVPYARLRAIEIELDVQWLAARLSDAAWYGWWPILAQMLGLHTDLAAHELVRARAIDVPAATRSPWLVALVEIDGAEAIERILSVSSTDDDRHAAVRALVAHSDPARAIAANALPGLEALSDYTLAPKVTAMLTQGRVADPAAALRLTSCVAGARAGNIDPLALARQGLQ